MLKTLSRQSIRRISGSRNYGVGGLLQEILPPSGVHIQVSTLHQNGATHRFYSNLSSVDPQLKQTPKSENKSLSSEKVELSQTIPPQKEAQLKSEMEKDMKNEKLNLYTSVNTFFSQLGREMSEDEKKDYDNLIREYEKEFKVSRPEKEGFIHRVKAFFFRKLDEISSDLEYRHQERVTKAQRKAYLREQALKNGGEDLEEQLRMIEEEIIFEDALPDANGIPQLTPVGIVNFMRGFDEHHYKSLKNIYHNSKNPYVGMVSYIEANQFTHPRLQLLWSLLLVLNLGDPAEGIRLLMLAAYRREYEALHYLAAFSFHGIGMERNISQAFAFLLASSAGGYAPSLHQAGLLYRKYNPQKMIENLTKAAQQGYPDALYDLGRIYLTGDGVVKNFDRAFYYLDLAHRAGHPEAAGQLGLCYVNGYGVNKNEEYAFQCWYQGAQQGDVESIRYMGISFEKGIGVEKNEKRAVDCYEIGASNNDAESMTYLGSCFEEGIGTEKNLKEAFQCYLEGGKRGDVLGAESCIRLSQEHGFTLDEPTRDRLLSIADPSLLLELKTIDRMKSLKEKKEKGENQEKVREEKDDKKNKTEEELEEIRFV